MKALPPLKGGWCCSSTDRSFGRAESQSVQPGQGSPSQASLQLFKQIYLEILKNKNSFTFASIRPIDRSSVCLPDVWWSDASIFNLPVIISDIDSEWVNIKPYNQTTNRTAKKACNKNVSYQKTPV